ncbi:hypothetical protein PHYSODRAFT_306145 [Phytophthora sojae]|uniref:RxLR effector protein n=1 Tax=Phytophthora sojae (strain P6497) TaxID=1094619 RepID=G5A824_PHYSP|nr:hypothetical protein PHYSODRAFT_306145 [Phytophthora sojae]EGZ08050.1 hypothetical protein PHYSODRAFT_306145 [Phytophthora sojae]|eukprot:XP_009536222.1 hypothetical protein PHYSODRAFT_306145 [Phytophthora sojae]
MQLLSTLTFLAIAIQCAVAAPERNLLRSGYDKPINFSDLSDLTTVASNPRSHQQPKHGYSTTPSSIDHLTGADPLSHIKKSGVLPSSNSLPVGDSNLLSGALGGPSTSTNSGTKAYSTLMKSGLSEDRSLTSPKKTPPPSPKKQSVYVSPSKKTSPKVPPKKLPKKNSHTPNQKKAKIDPAKTPVQRAVV